MRIWSLHSRYLDRQGLIACWRETLLAQAVLAGRTRGYANHPQLQRFRATDDPGGSVSRYLAELATEADARGYRFDRTRILPWSENGELLDVTTGQLDVEWEHLRGKLRARSPEMAERWAGVDRPDPHPLFRVVPGGIAAWERARPGREKP